MFNFFIHFDDGMPNPYAVEHSPFQSAGCARIKKSQHYKLDHQLVCMQKMQQWIHTLYPF
jgi:hypothetical protein